MAAGEPDAAAVLVLAAIVTVLTFLSGFVSVRLHDAYREAAERQRQLGRQLITRTGTFPVTELEEDYEATRQSLPDALATPVLLVLVVFTILGIWLTVATKNAAHLPWFGTRALERRGALALLALALVAVTLLVGADYFRLRHRLGAAIDNSVVHKLLQVEAAVARVWAAKLRLANAVVRKEYAGVEWGTTAARLEETKGSVAKLDKTPAQQRGEAWHRERARWGKLLAAEVASVASIKTVLDTCAREEASATREVRQAEPDLKQVQRILTDMGKQPGLEGWAHILGLRAIVGLAEAFDPEWDSCDLSPERTVEIRGWLQAAMNSEPGEPRWLAAAAFFSEAVGDVAGAAECTIRNQELQEMATEWGFLLHPPEESGKQAWLGARQPSTFRAAYELKKQVGDWDSARNFAYGYLIATCRRSIVDIPDKKTFVSVVDRIREAIAATSSDGETGWWLAERSLQDFRAFVGQWYVLLMQEVLRIDLAAQLDIIERDEVAPRREGWEAANESRRARDADEDFYRFGRLHGVVIKDGMVSVGGRGSCKFDAATASIIPAKSRHVARILRSTDKGVEREVYITIKTGTLALTSGPFLDSARLRRWADEFTSRAVGQRTEKVTSESFGWLDRMLRAVYTYERRRA